MDEVRHERIECELTPLLGFQTALGGTVREVNFALHARTIIFLLNELTFLPVATEDISA